MLKRSFFAALASASLALPLGAGAQSAPPLTANETLVLKAMDEVFNQRDPAAVARYWGTTYVQHNPGIPNGTEGLLGLIKSLGPGFRYEPGMIASRGDIVTLHGRYLGWGPKPMIAVDIFRVRDGRLVEHWDVIQPEVPADQTRSGNAMFEPVRY